MFLHNRANVSACLPFTVVGVAHVDGVVARIGALVDALLVLVQVRVRRVVRRVAVRRQVRVTMMDVVEGVRRVRLMVLVPVRSRAGRRSVAAVAHEPVLIVRRALSTTTTVGKSEREREKENTQSGDGTHTHIRHGPHLNATYP
jgi:hypothetical protein